MSYRHLLRISFGNVMLTSYSEKASIFLESFHDNPKALRGHGSVLVLEVATDQDGLGWEAFGMKSLEGDPEGFPVLDSEAA